MQAEIATRNIVGKNIHRYREAAELSVAELAAKAGMDRTNLYRIEQTGTNYSNDSLTKIAKALNVSIGALFAEADTLPWGRMVPLDIVTPEMIHLVAGKLRIDRPAHEAGGISNVVFTDGSFADSAFAFKVNDRAMSPLLVPDDMVIVDPTISAEPNDIVLAAVYRKSTGKTQSLVRRFAERTDGFELLPVDVAYAVEFPLEDNIKILGTVVEQRKQRRR